MKYLKKWLFILTPMLFISMTALCQGSDSSKVTIPTSLNKFYIAKTIQAGLDSISLLDCEQEALMQEFKYQAMEMQSESFKIQLIGNAEQLNKSLQRESKLTKNVKTKNVLLLGLSIITGILIIK